MKAVVAITRTELTRFLRDRANLFFVFALPLLLVVFIGAQFGAGTGTPLGVVAADDDAAAATLMDELDDLEAVRVERLDDLDELVDGVRRGHLGAGVVVPTGYGAALERGEVVAVRFVSRPDDAALRSVVAAVAGPPVAVIDAARGAGEVLDEDLDAGELVALAGELRGLVPQVEVVTSSVGEDGLAAEFAGLGQFDLGASSQLFLFVFLTSLAGSAALIQTRQFGVATRMRATPTPTFHLLLGLVGGRFLVAVLQAVYIVGATVLLFGVDWGDPLAAAILVTLFCLVAAGAAVVVGSLFRNDAQAGGAGVGLGLVLAALGGSMVPLDVFPDGARTVALLTPHGWANTAIAELVRRDGGVGDIALELAVLTAFAAALLALGTVLLRRALARPLD